MNFKNLLLLLTLLVTTLVWAKKDKVTVTAEEGEEATSAVVEEVTSVVAEDEELTLIPGPVICEYKKKDLNVEYDVNEDVFIRCEEGSCTVKEEAEGAVTSAGFVNITTAGTYILQGELNGQVYIEATKNDFIHLVLEDATIASSHGPAIYGAKADKITITIVGNNTLIDTENYTFEDGEDEPDACLFIDSDLSLNGNGSLTVTGNYNDAIRCKKDLRIVSPTIIVPNAVKKGIKAKNSLCIDDAEIDVTAQGTAIKVTRDDDAEKGYIVIDSGRISVSTGKDGIHAETHLTINNGYIDVKESNEGIEAQMIDILGGEVHIKAANDGINASKITPEEEDEDEVEEAVETEGSEPKGEEGDDDRQPPEDEPKDHEEEDGAKPEEKEGQDQNGPEDREEPTEGFNRGGPNGNDHGFGGGQPNDESATGTDGSVYINIVGGKVYVTVSGNDCDGIDSNGVLYIGGEAEVYTSIEGGDLFGNMAALDSEGTNAIVGDATVVVTADGSKGGMGHGQDGERPEGDAEDGNDNERPQGPGGRNKGERPSRPEEDENGKEEERPTPPEGEDQEERPTPPEGDDHEEGFEGRQGQGQGQGQGGPGGNESAQIYQPYINTSVDSQEAGTTLTVLNSDQEVVVSYTPSVSFSNILITSPKLVANETYTIILGSNTQTVIATAGEEGGVDNAPSVLSPTDTMESHTAAVEEEEEETAVATDGTEEVEEAEGDKAAFLPEPSDTEVKEEKVEEKDLEEAVESNAEGEEIPDELDQANESNAEEEEEKDKVKAKEDGNDENSDKESDLEPETDPRHGPSESDSNDQESHFFSDPISKFIKKIFGGADDKEKEEEEAVEDEIDDAEDEEAIEKKENVFSFYDEEEQDEAEEEINDEEDKEEKEEEEKKEDKKKKAKEDQEDDEDDDEEQEEDKELEDDEASQEELEEDEESKEEDSEEETTSTTTVTTTTEVETETEAALELDEDDNEGETDPNPEDQENGLGEEELEDEEEINGAEGEDDEVEEFKLPKHFHFDIKRKGDNFGSDEYKWRRE